MSYDVNIGPCQCCAGCCSDLGPSSTFCLEFSSGTGTCSCLDGVQVTLTWNAGCPCWDGTYTTSCPKWSDAQVQMGCNNNAFYLTAGVQLGGGYGCGFTSVTNLTWTCSPFQLEADVTLTDTGPPFGENCCAGTVHVTVVEGGC